ncbi:MAG: PspC domain-containing protein [Lachnospiraceae bacterium]|nr:PspC domain-containing protein [Lachnospiraceae bacterium]
MGDKKLYRSNNNKMICGVCGGLGEYLNVDPTLIRLIWAVLVLAAGTGVLVYILAAIIMPYQQY